MTCSSGWKLLGANNNAQTCRFTICTTQIWIVEGNTQIHAMMAKKMNMVKYCLSICWFEGQTSPADLSIVTGERIMSFSCNVDPEGKIGQAGI